MTIYLDIIFIENMCMNYIILFATGYIAKIKINQIRILISSCLGSTYAILMYLNSNFFFSNILMKILLSIVIILISFNPKKVRKLSKQLILFYLISFVFGGCATFLLYFIKPQDILIRNGVYVGRYPLKVVLLAGIVGFALTKISFRHVREKINRKDMYVKINIFLNNNNVQVKALIDTGNMLKDPISGTPVIVVCKDELYSLLPQVVLDNLENIINGNVLEELSDVQDIVSKFRVIPFSSLGKQNGILLGIKIDKVEIYFEETIEMIKNIIVGIYDKKLSKDDRYAALIGLNVLERSEKSEFTSNVKVKY